ncbi:MAG: Maf family protein [Phycisphaerae bacterium]
MPPLILASASPRRRELLTQAGIAHDVVACTLIEPTRTPVGLPPRAWAMALAYFKASDVARRHPRRWVLGADTIVICGDRILGKPQDAADARAMLELQAGVWTDVVTGVALVRDVAAGATRHIIGVVTRVFMRDDHAVREAYIAGGEWEGKAGAYGIQDIGDQLVERIEGSFSNVVGLPMERVKELLHDYGV